MPGNRTYEYSTVKIFWGWSLPPGSNIPITKNQLHWKWTTLIFSVSRVWRGHLIIIRRKWPEKLPRGCLVLTIFGKFSYKKLWDAPLYPGHRWYARLNFNLMQLHYHNTLFYYITLPCYIIPLLHDLITSLPYLISSLHYLFHDYITFLHHYIITLPYYVITLLFASLHYYITFL